MPGNRLRVLRDARENYPAWAAAIESARRTIHLEMYIVHDDATGRRFRDALVARATAGVTVRVLYDWFGSLRLVGRGFWAPLRAAGGEVRVANPPSLDSLLGWASRDHRKLLTVDGAEAFISGLCIGDAWAGDPARGIAPWRDTGVQLAGPAVADAEAAFAAAWALAGPPIAPAELPRREAIPAAGTVTLRVIASAPETTELYRMDLLVAVAARERLWLTDAYFMATPPYRQALRSAALDGVDVRLLVPHGSDIEWIANVSRTMYRSLLEAGVRVFEWNGPMVHAKTAVADGRWTRIGSTNLNVCELARQLGARRGHRGRGDRPRDGRHLPRGPDERDRDRHHTAEHGAGPRAWASGAVRTRLQLPRAERRNPDGQYPRGGGQGSPDAGAE